jgi:kynurenine formamidase
MSVPLRQAEVPGWERGRGWGWIWGEGDERGALNAMTPASIAESLSNVSQGRVFDLGVKMDRGSFRWAGHVGTEVVTFRSPEGLLREQVTDPVYAGVGSADGVGFHTSMVVISDHAGTQIDALCHATSGADRHWYNGFVEDEHGSDFGPKRAGAEQIPPIVLNGVLIDVPAHLGVDECAPGYVMSPDVLRAALDAQGVDIAPGEAVFLRSGSMRHWAELGADHDKLGPPGTAGIDLAGARWLCEKKGAILIGSDTSTVEVVPPVDGDNVSPVHKYLLVDQGVHMGELFFLEELAAARVYRFCFVALAPKVVGTTAGFAMRPVAIV